ncbi:PKD domain-containing protein [Candidatus Peregrinibacteria bacterium]|nr:PKD domain-containing protein [Candidatus Peregrinibacteria bacterium]
MIKKLSKGLLALLFCITISSRIANAENNQNSSYLKAVINLPNAVEIKKSNIFDASQSYIPENSDKISYDWDFGDGNRNEGVEVLHSYKDPGYYDINLKVSDGKNTSESTLKVFAYRKLIILITDQSENKDRIGIIQNYAENKGVYLKVIDSYGSSTEFISEEILTKKITEASDELQKSKQIVIWAKENAGLNAISRFIQNNSGKIASDFSQKTLIVLDNSIEAKISRVQRQFNLIKPKIIVITKEGAIDALIESLSEEEFINTLKERGNVYEIVDAKSGKLLPWNFMSYFVNALVNSGIPDNTIALLLLLPVIATVVAIMRQVVGITTFGIYTPTIITLSFLIIGIQVGLLTLAAAIIVAIIAKPIFKKTRMLFIPKMAVVLTIVTLVIFLILISGNYLGLFNAQFLSIAIFPMLILSTLVEKFITTRTESGLSSAMVLMLETLLVAIIAYFIAGGEIYLGFTVIKFEFVKRMMLTYPELIFVLIIIDVMLGKWTGLRVLERIRFREILRHIEE